jgi:hypothetical protein
MQNCRQAQVQIRTGNKTGIWLALAVALGLHTVILLLPITSQKPPTENVRAQIELQLTTFTPPLPAAQVPAQLPETIPPVSLNEPSPEPPIAIVEAQDEVESPVLTTSPQARDLEHNPEKMSEPAKSRLTNSILTRQFISEESEADELFGRKLEQHSSEPQKEYHYPVRQNMIAILDRPMQDLPFAYTPGLVNFAYDPGVKGDLQRFWDVITPEFGWRTKNGTEFKCIWVLIIGGCGWK